jgi:hypothetical protein
LFQGITNFRDATAFRTPLWIVRHILLDDFHQQILLLRCEIQLLPNGVPETIVLKVLGCCLLVPTFFGEGVCGAIYIDSRVPE